MTDSDDPAMPRQSKWWFDMFRWYSRRYIRKHFHALRISKSSHAVPAGEGEPLLFVINHPAWWDILVAFVLCERFKHYSHFAPIDSRMFEKYRMFAKMGFFGVDPTPRGAARFLRTSKAIFEQPFRSMWITAQGEFVDVRVRPVQLRPGIGYVASRLDRGFVIPVAVEYTYWEERTPEALVRYGEPLNLAEHRDWDRDTWTQQIARHLEQSQDELAREVMTRSPEQFEILVSGKVGVGGVYDWWRRFKGWFTGKKFDVAHSAPSSTSETPA
jgi:1-acyl-sn-glycerol-3-phosphate acyltransferase